MENTEIIAAIQEIIRKHMTKKPRKIKRNQPTTNEKLDNFKETARELLNSDSSPMELMEALLDAMYDSFGTIDSNEAVSRALDNHYVSPNEIGCFIGKTEFSNVIPLVAGNLNDILKMGALEKLMKLDSNTLDDIVSEHNLWY